MKINNKLQYHVEKICGWLLLAMPISIAMGRGVADANLSLVSLFFCAFLFLARDFSCFKEQWVKISFLMWVYFVLNSVFRENNVGSVLKTLPFIRFIIFALCFQCIATHQQNFDKKLLVVLAIVVGFLVIDGYIQFFSGKDLFGRAKLFDDMGNYQYYRLTGPFSKRVLGSVITILSPAVIAFLLYKIKEFSKQSIVFVGMIILIEVLVFLTGERSALVHSALTLVVLFVLIFKEKIRFSTICGLGVCAALGLYFVLPQELIVRHLDSIRILKQGSGSAYGMLWKASWLMGLGNLWFGVGAMNFQEACQELVSECSYHSHNVYLEMFSEFGIVGLFLFLSFLYVIFKEIIQYLKGRKNYDTCYLFLGISIAIFMKLLPFLPSSGFFKNWYAVPLWFMIGWMLRLRKQL